MIRLSLVEIERELQRVFTLGTSETARENESRLDLHRLFKSQPREVRQYIRDRSREAA